MNAKEMFEGIGYKLSEAYSEDTLISYFDGKKNITIEFYIKNKQFKKAKGVFDCVAIKESELKAIIQQCKELGWLEEEKQKTKEETNFEHYFEYLSEKRMMDFALINGRVTKCSVTQCSECNFNHDCIEGKFKWLKQAYEKPKYKLTQFEYDLLSVHKDFKTYNKIANQTHLFKMREKGYFKDIDTNIPIREILDNCEVVG